MINKVLNTKLNILISQTFLILIVVPFLLPWWFLNAYPQISNALLYLSLLLIILYSFYNFNKIKWSTLLLFIALYFILIFSTILNGGLIKVAFGYAMKTLLICVFLSIINHDNKMKIILLTVLRNITFIFFLINFYFLIKYPQGIPSITENYLVPYFIYGNINTTVKMILPGYISSLIIDLNKNNISIISIFFFMGTIYSYVFIYNTATSLVGVLIISLWFIFFNRFRNYAKTFYIILLISVIVLNLIFIYGSSSSVFKMISDFFGKDITFSGRTYLWKNAMNIISDKPIFGFGSLDNNLVRNYIGNRSGAHNYYIDIIFQRGYLGFFNFMIILLLPVINNINLDKSRYMLLGACCSYIVMFMVEPFHSFEFLILPIFYFLSLNDYYLNTKDFSIK